MFPPERIAVLEVTSAGEWRAWLAALCFGWIHSKALRRDAESTYLCCTPRKPASTWSRVNRDRVARLTEAGLMTPAGQAAVDLARRTGTGDVLAEAQDGVVPADRGDGRAGAGEPPGRPPVRRERQGGSEPAFHPPVVSGNASQHRP